MNFQPIYKLIIPALLLILSLAACDSQPVAPPPAAGSTGAVKNVALLLPASRTDQGWNQQATDSITTVAKKHGFKLEVAENLGYDDITPVLRDLTERGFDLIICHASGYQTVCPELANQAKVKVAVVENPGAIGPNVSDIETQAQEVAYLAGVAAAKLTRSKKVGIVVSGEPPTWNFMTVGFAEGVKATNPAVEIIYSVIGEAAYEDAAGAKRVTESELAAGADIILGMGDGASFGMLQAIQEYNAQNGAQARFIDVIGNKSNQYRDVLLTSVLFDYGGLYDQMLGDLEQGTFGKVYTMDVASGGVRLLEFPSDVPAEVVKTVEQAKADLITGKIKVSAIGDAAGMRQRLAELK